MKDLKSEESSRIKPITTEEMALTISCDIDEDQNVRRFELSSHQKKMIILSFLPTHRIWGLKLPRRQLVTYDIFYIITVSLLGLLIAGLVIDNGKCAVVGALIIFYGIVMLYLMGIVHQTRVIKNLTFDIPGIRENLKEIFELRQTRDGRTDMNGKYFVEAAYELKKTHDVEGKLSFKLLFPSYQTNLNNCFHVWKKTGEIIPHVTKSALKWESNNNGLELLYAMFVFNKEEIAAKISYTIATTVGNGLFILVEWCLMAVVGFDLYGIVLRFAVPIFLLVPGFMIGYSVYECAITHSLHMINPKSFIDVDNLYKISKSQEFLIDVFDVDTLRTYGTLTLQFRKTIQGFQHIDIPRMKIAVIATLVMIAVGLGLYAIGGEENEVFGYGIFTMFLAFSVILLIVMLGTGFAFGILYNTRIRQQIEALDNLKTLYKQMSNIRKNNLTQNCSKKLQLLFGTINGKNVDFDKLTEVVEEVKIEIEEFKRRSPYKFVEIFACETNTIASLFSPLIIIMWTAVVHSITLIINLSKKYIDTL